MEWSHQHSMLTAKVLIAIGILLLVAVALWLEYRDLPRPSPDFPTGFQAPA